MLTSSYQQLLDQLPTFPWFTPTEEFNEERASKLAQRHLQILRRGYPKLTINKIKFVYTDVAQLNNPEICSDLNRYYVGALIHHRKMANVPRVEEKAFEKVYGIVYRNLYNWYCNRNSKFTDIYVGEWLTGNIANIVADDAQCRAVHNIPNPWSPLTELLRIGVLPWPMISIDEEFVVIVPIVPLEYDDFDPGAA